MILTREEFHNVVKEYDQIKLLDNYDKDREFMYLDDESLGWYDVKNSAVRVITRFIMFDDNYGHLHIASPSVPGINMRKVENFSNHLKELLKQKKQLEIEIKLMEIEKDF